MRPLYNRYVPQADGSYQKIQLREPRQQSPSSLPDLPDHILEPLPEAHRPPALGIGSFFKNLFPGGLDTEDLLVILLLLLLGQDGGKNGNRALLTLGAYLFL